MITTGKTRGVLVLDENLLSLCEELRDRNFRVFVSEPETLASDFIKKILPGRVLVTNNLKDFVDDAAAFDFGIIVVSQALLADPIDAAAQISREWSRRSLHASGPFVLAVSLGRASFRTLLP